MRGSCLLVVLGTLLATSLAEVCTPGEDFDGYICQGLTSLDKLSELPPVVTLKLEKSNISRIPSDAFGRLGETLSELKMTGCGVEEIEAGAFRGLDKLETLDLTDNRIETIEVSWMRGLPKLKKLIVWRNRIHTIHPLVYDELPKLEVLDLASNKLVKCIDETDMKKLKSLKKILIASNPWSYRCRPSMARVLQKSGVRWIKDWSVGDLLIEECLAHQEGADLDDKILYKCVDEKSFQSVSPLLTLLGRTVRDMLKKVDELRKDVDVLQKLK